MLGSGDDIKQALPYAEIVNPQSINKYQYSYNNPLQYIDPDGHQGEEKKSLKDQLLELLGRIFKGRTRQDGIVAWIRRRRNSKTRTKWSLRYGSKSHDL